MRSEIILRDRNRRQKMESIYGAGFWIVCPLLDLRRHFAVLITWLTLKYERSLSRPMHDLHSTGCSSEIAVQAC